MVQDSQNTIVAAGNLIFDPNNRKILLVQEGNPKLRGKWNFPMGRLEPKDGRGAFVKSIIKCAGREGREETGRKVTPCYFIGKYTNRLTQKHIVISFIFNSEIAEGELKLPGDILAAGWFSIEEIKELGDKELLVGPCVLSAIDDFMKGKKIPLDSSLIVI